MKGITPVIAVILLLLMTVSIAGFAFVFLQRSTESIAQSGGDQLQEQLRQSSQQFSIITVDKNQVTIRNTGTTPITNPVFLANNKLINKTGPASLAPGGIGTYTLSAAQFPATETVTIKAAASTAFTDQLTTTPKNELLANPDFENGLSGWAISGHVSDTNQSVSGSASARLTNSQSVCNDYIRQDLAVTPNTTYVFSGWIKKTPTVSGNNNSGNYTGSNYPGIYVTNTTWGSPAYSASLTGGEHNWTYLNLTINSGSYTTLRFSMFMWWCGSGSSGSIWYDNARLYRLY